MTHQIVWKPRSRAQYVQYGNFLDFLFDCFLFVLSVLFLAWNSHLLCRNAQKEYQKQATHNNIYLYNTNCDTMNFQIFKTLPILELLRSRVRLVKALALSSAPWNASLMLSSVCVMFVSFLNSIEKRTITLPFLAEKKIELQIQYVAIVFNIYLILKNIRLKSLIIHVHFLSSSYAYLKSLM